MKVVMFRKSMSLISILISFITGSSYTHAALIINGTMYDASEARGSVGVSKPLAEYGDREILVFDLHPDFKVKEAVTWALIQLGKKYDYKGVFGWIFSRQENRKLYCFEYVMGALAIAGYQTPSFMKLTGDDIIDALRANPSYFGRADGYGGSK